jgi:hypothetical protein
MSIVAPTKANNPARCVHILGLELRSRDPLKAKGNE